VTTFAPDPRVLRALGGILAIDGGYSRVAWTPGEGRTIGLRPRSEEEAIQVLVAEFDALEFSRLEIAPPRSELVYYDFPVSELGGWSRMVRALSEDRDVVLSAGSRRRRGMGTCDRAAVLWCRVESRKQADALRRFRPSPTLVVREGESCRMTALWSLRRPLAYEWLLRANKRIAHRLGAAKKWAEPEFTFPAPGSCLRAGRSRPVPVRVEFWQPCAIFTAREVVGHLRDAPNPDAWREAAAA
jgi:hypothetical protein